MQQIIEKTKIISEVELREEAERYYNANSVKILNDKGFFKMKKDREKTTMWTCCIVCIGLAFILTIAKLHADLGVVFDGIGCFFVFMTVSFAGGIGMYIGMLFVWFRDRSLLNDLADRMKREFINEYLVMHK